MKSRLPSVEILESRIAPAVFFVSPTASGPNALKVLNADGSDAMDTARETAAKTAANSTVAVELGQGDRLVYDTNHNLLFDKGDRLLAEVFSGSGMFFLTDGVIAKKAGFELTEITGLATAAGFSGHIHADINGPVATALDATGFHPALVPATSLDGLTIDGQVKGAIMATGSISHVSVGGPLFNPKSNKFSVGEGLFAGDGIQQADPYSFNGHVTNFETDQLASTMVTGGAGLSFITLKQSTFQIIAGQGKADDSSAPGSYDGGSIDHVVVRNGFQNLFVFAGDGGDGASSGQGGAITNSSFTLSPTTNNVVRLVAGFGGVSTGTDGGDGGGVDRVSVHLLTNGGQLAILGGDAQSTGGDGGGVSNLTVRAKDLVAETPGYAVLTIRGGIGKTSVADGIVAKGGNVEHLAVSFGGAKGTFEQNVEVSGGRGGFDEASRTPLGLGGSVSDVRIALLGKQGAAVQGGNGGGPGSQGGSVSSVRIYNFGSTSAAQVTSGGALGGQAGDISDVFYANYVNQNGGLNVTAAGGDQGGSIDGIELVNVAPSMDEIHVQSGDGVNGAAGSIAGVHSVSRGAVFSTYIFAGDGTQSGGAVSDLSLEHTGKRGQEGISIVPGGQFMAQGNIPTDGHASVGAIHDVHVYAPRADVEIGQEVTSSFDQDFKIVYQLNPLAGGTVLPAAAAGNGGDIQRITGTVGTLRLIAASGGSSQTGQGGAGGSISEVQMTILKSAEMIAAGDGGPGFFGGAAGSLSDLDIQGDIGNFRKAFTGFNLSNFEGMGGLIAGQGGASSFTSAAVANGSITDVSATRIAAIFAGRTAPVAFTAANAVESITRLQADVLGADTKIKVAGAHQEVSAVGTFDFTGGTDNVFTLGSDTPIDGLVIVRTGGLLTPLPVPPLKLIET